MMASKASRKATPRVEATPAGAAGSAVEGAAAPLSIVGFGASAGGVEALETFFRHVPPDSGLAFVVVQHLDPSHASILTEILQRCTTMPVAEVEDRMAVAPDTVHVVPPNRDMVIFHGALRLSVPDVPRGQRMPIDTFLRSLAEDQGERSVGIVLSGTGTDGTLGLRAILGAGGITLVQEPATAKYDGMPTSAIRAGYATKVLPVEEMPQALLSGARNLRQHRPESALVETSLPAGGMSRLLAFVRSATGHDFSLYKKSTIGRRIERRMAQHDLTDMEVYARYLKENPAESQALFKELLINVTSFFRDPEAFVALKQDVLPQLLAAKAEGYVFRVWVAGCATGEEAYSIAILLREVMDESQRDVKIQIYATDLDEDAITVARAGLYPPNVAADVAPERLRRFFVKDEVGYRVKKEIREMVVFATQDLIKDPPFTKLDLLCCRNLMIYLEPELQSRLISSFHYALRPGGALFLSPSESIGSHPDLFTPLNRKWKLYGAIHWAASGQAAVARSYPSEISGRGRAEAAKKAKEFDFAKLTRQALLQTYAPASVLADAKGNILYVHGEIGRYLRLPPGQATLNLVDMAREGLQSELRTALFVAASQGTATREREVSVRTDGALLPVSLSVHPLSDLGVGLGQKVLLVSFKDIVRPPARKRRGGRHAAGTVDGQRAVELERELAHTRESLSATIEEQQASNEELKSINEELQSTNEELQSTNEELETSKEELQSVNEELLTVNSELQTKIEQLAGMQNDMKNLLDNIEVGTIFLDDDLRIRRFSREAAKVYRLVATDIGRALADIKSNLDHDDLIGEAQAVLNSLAPFEHEVRTGSGHYYLARIQPYRTMDNVIDGVVLTFTDISTRIEAQAKEREARQLAESIVDTVREPLVVLDRDMKVVAASRSFYRRFRVAPEETLGRKINELGNREWDIPSLRELLETVLPFRQSFDDFIVEHEFPIIGRCRLVLNARRIVGEAENRELILLAMEDLGGSDGAQYTNP